MALDKLVHDDLPVNEPYAGLVAQAYDVWMPPSGDDADAGIYRGALGHATGPALELGCGNGRLLVGYVRDGFEVEGVDSSSDMLAICAEHGRAAGVDLTLHHADWLTLDLGRTYATIYNPAGSFALIAGPDDARRAVTAWRKHLEPGGRMLISMSVPTTHLDANYEWHVRRSATRARDGVTFMVHEALQTDVETQVQHSLHRHELWASDGELMTTFIRRNRLHWWTQGQLEELLRTCDYTDVHSYGSADQFITVAHAP